MSESVVHATVRVTIAGSAGRIDLAVPFWVEVAELSRAYAGSLGGSGEIALTTTTGRVLDASRPLSQCNLQDGDVLVAVTGQERHVGEQRAQLDQGGASSAFVWPSSWTHGIYFLVSAFALGAGSLAAVEATGAVRTACIALLLLCAVAAAVPTGLGRGSEERFRAAAAPAFAAAAGLVAAYSPSGAGVLLGVAVAGLAAATAAATARALSTSEDDELLVGWLTVAAVYVVSATGVLIAGGTPVSLWAVLLAAALIASRLLPFLVVDVPDQVLLDLDRLAITAWSAREQPRGTRRRRTVIKPAAVADMVHRGHRLVATGVVAASLTAATAGPLLVREASEGTDVVGARLMVLFVGAALALVSRSFRSPVPRLGLRLTGAWVLAFLGADVLMSTSLRTTGWLVVIGAVVAMLVIVAGLALGRGWRSIWWARITDVLEGLCIVLALAALPVAAGLFAFVRQMTS